MFCAVIPKIRVSSLHDALDQAARNGLESVPDLVHGGDSVLTYNIYTRPEDEGPLIDFLRGLSVPYLTMHSA